MRYLYWSLVKWAYDVRLRRYCWQHDRLVWWWHPVHEHRYVVLDELLNDEQQ